MGPTHALFFQRIAMRSVMSGLLRGGAKDWTKRIVDVLLPESMNASMSTPISFTPEPPWSSACTTFCSVSISSTRVSGATCLGSGDIVIVTPIFHGGEFESMVPSAAMALVAGAITLMGYGTLVTSSYPPLQSMGAVSLVSVVTLVVASVLVGMPRMIS